MICPGLLIMLGYKAVKDTVSIDISPPPVRIPEPQLIESEAEVPDILEKENGKNGA